MDDKTCPECQGTGVGKSRRALETLVGSLVLLAGDESARHGVMRHPYFQSTPLWNERAPKLHEVTAGLAGRSPRSLGHDAIDRWNATEKILIAAGLPKEWDYCPACGGEGEQGSASSDENTPP